MQTKFCIQNTQIQCKRSSCYIGLFSYANWTYRQNRYSHVAHFFKIQHFFCFIYINSGLNITKNSNLAYDLLKRIHHLSNDASISCYTLVHYDETWFTFSCGHHQVKFYQVNFPSLYDLIMQKLCVLNYCFECRLDTTLIVWSM